MDVLSDFVLENRPGDALMCIVMLSVCLSVCLSPFHSCAPIVRSVCKVWLPFLLNNYAIHSRASTRQLFSQTVSRSLSALVSHQSGSNVQAETFHYVGELCYTAGCQLCHNKGRWPLKTRIRGYLRVCVCVCARLMIYQVVADNESGAACGIKTARQGFH